MIGDHRKLKLKFQDILGVYIIIFRTKLYDISEHFQDEHAKFQKTPVIEKKLFY